MVELVVAVEAAVVEMVLAFDFKLVDEEIRTEVEVMLRVEETEQQLNIIKIMVIYQRLSRMMQIPMPDEAEGPEIFSVVGDMEPAEAGTDYWA
jgi:hypothetical protein